MSEFVSPQTPSRENIVDKLQQLLKFGKHPDGLPHDDPEVVAAHRLYFDYCENILQTQTNNLTPENSLNLSTIYVDAGFDDPDYLDEVANDWLTQDLLTAETVGQTEMVEQIRAKIDEINNRIIRA
ncbi:MAG: hypothetical protein NVSMB46_03430 [Candidatus Saccharimonadales bacterium]